MDLLNDVLKLIKEKEIEVQPTKIYRLDQVNEAHKYLESSNGIGKVIVLED